MSGPPVPTAEEIPEEKREQDQWLMFDTDNDVPRRPHWQGNFGISWSDPDEWHSFEQAREAAQEKDSWGIGFVMASENEDHPRGIYGAIDIDGCVESEHGTPKDWVPSLEPIMGDDPSYIEWSPSGKGLHIPIAGLESPDWWSDVHFSDDEHEGVEVLTNKFVTFTGDQLRNTGDSVADANQDIYEWLAQAYKGITGDDPREENVEDESSGLQGGVSVAGNHSASGGEWFDADTASEALEHIDPDVAYPTWRDIGFALADEFSTGRAKRLFKDWSRSGTKWDSDAEQQADRIIDDASSGGGRTIATVVYHAKQGGWEPAPAQPATPDGGASVAEQEDTEAELGPDNDDGEIPTLEEGVRETLQAYNELDDMTEREVIHQVALLISEHRDYVKPRQAVGNWRSVLYRYDPLEGIYRPDGEEHLEELAERLLGGFLNNTQRNELVGKVERMNHGRQEQLETEPHRLIVDNGILDLRTGDLDDWDPEEYHQAKIPIEYHEDATCERIDEFFHEVVEDKDVPTLYQLAAHTLYKRHAAQKAAMLVGDGSNGKSVFLDLLEHFIGSDNVSHQSLQSLSHDQFAANNLHNQFANFHPDMSDEKIQDLGMFKKLTGGDTMQADVKFEKPITFENFATLIFAANTMPELDEDTRAVWRRWVYINFPYTFDDSDPDAKDETAKRVLMRELTAEEELQGLLARAVEEINEWWNGRDWFARVQSPEQVRETMKRASEPVYAFATACLEEEEDGKIPKPEVRDAYRKYARQEDLPLMDNSRFGEELVNFRDYPIKDGQARIDGTPTRVYKGVSWSSRGRQLLGLDQPDDENQADIGDGGPPERADQLLRSMRDFGADSEPKRRPMILGKAMGDNMNQKQAEYAFDELKETGRIYQPPEGSGDEWMISE